MGTIGDCDNGMMESFWGRMQTELLSRRKWKTRIELADALFDYLEIFHNRQRRHRSLACSRPTNMKGSTPPCRSRRTSCHGSTEPRESPFTAPLKSWTAGNKHT
jgi:hypothetical protein